MTSNQKSRESWARILAQAWADEAFKAQLLLHPNKILKENGFPLAPNTTYTILEDTDTVNHIVIHTSADNFQYEGSPRAKVWKDLIKKIKSDSQLKEEFLAHPAKIMKEYGIPVSGHITYRVAIETEKNKYQVLLRPPKNTLSEEELDRIAAGIDLCGHFCTDTCSG